MGNILSVKHLSKNYQNITAVHDISLAVEAGEIVGLLGPNGAGKTTEWLAWPLPMVLSLISGVYYPIDTLPPSLAFVAELFPPAYVFESLRAQLEQTATGPMLMHNLILGLGLALFYLFLAYRFFLKVYRHNLRTGKLARFNASI